jgi:hypothetical protein
MSGAMKLADVALPQFQLEYAGPSGPCEVAIEQAATVAFEFVAPVRAFARYRGQRSNTGRVVVGHDERPRGVRVLA